MKEKKQGGSRFLESSLSSFKKKASSLSLKHTFKFSLALFISVCFIFQANIAKPLAETASDIADTLSEYSEDLQQTDVFGQIPETLSDSTEELPQEATPQPINATISYILSDEGRILTITATGATKDAPEELPFNGTSTWITTQGISAAELANIETVQFSGHIQFPTNSSYAFASSMTPGWSSLKNFVLLDGEDNSLSFAADANAEGMFRGSNVTKPASLENIKGTIDFSNIDKAASMFESCGNLKELPSTFDVPKATNTSYMFRYCSSLKELPSLTARASTTVVNMFQNCANLEEIPSFSVSLATDNSYMFAGCSALAKLPETFNPKNVTKATGMFLNCSALKTVPFSELKSIQECAGMFLNCSSLEDISFLKDWNVSQVKGAASGKLGFEGMFSGCSSLKDVSALKDWKIDESNKELVPLLPGLHVGGLSGMFGSFNKSLATVIADGTETFNEDVPAPPITKMSFGAGWGKMDSDALLSIGVWQPTEEALQSAAKGETNLPWLSLDTPSQGEYPSTEALFKAFGSEWNQGTWWAEEAPEPSPTPEPDVNPSEEGGESAGNLPATGDIVSFYSFLAAAMVILGAVLVLKRD